jgi:hypothetical protein
MDCATCGGGVGDWVEYTKLAVSGVGTMIVVYQLYLVLRNMKSNAYAKLYDQYLKVNEIFVNKPHLRPYFNPNVKSNSPAVVDPAEIDAMCEILVGLLEHAELQKDSMPNKNCWTEYTKGRFEQSAALWKFLDAHPKWYADEFHALLKRENVRRPTE